MTHLKIDKALRIYVLEDVSRAKRLNVSEMLRNHVDAKAERVRELLACLDAGEHVEIETRSPIAELLRGMGCVVTEKENAQ